MTGLDLPVDLGRGLVLPNPVGLASGTAGYGFELRRLIDLDRLGALFVNPTKFQPCGSVAGIEVRGFQEIVLRLVYLRSFQRFQAFIESLARVFGR